MDPLKIHSTPATFRRPIMILAFTGWNDAAESATTAARYLTASFSGEKFAEIDAEEFYHFGLSRPYTRFKPGSDTEKEIVWPATEFSISQSADLTRDVTYEVSPPTVALLEAIGSPFGSLLPRVGARRVLRHRWQQLGVEAREPDHDLVA